ncbi:hypothetical protein RI129_008848 [Pyrocoelia pectoralis]|uniref:Uncharacterized protein n=1 Tax=Pyrocoelia pectoralis TaxID=417401 RepID=A0AAN7ZLE5_9COLE
MENCVNPNINQSSLVNSIPIKGLDYLSTKIEIISKLDHKILKADRSILQRLLAATSAGRTVDLDAILQHELLPVPIALAEMNGCLRTGNKALLAQIMLNDISVKTSMSEVDLGFNATLILDAMAIVNAIGKPPGATEFGHIGIAFVSAVLRAGEHYSRIDVLFDRYYPQSITAGTRAKGAGVNILLMEVLLNANGLSVLEGVLITLL